MHPKERIKATSNLCLIVSGSWVNNEHQSPFGKMFRFHGLIPQCKVFSANCQSVPDKIMRLLPNYYIIIQNALMKLKICTLL